MSKVFNGTTDLIDLGSTSALDDIGGVDGPRSCAAWIYPIGWGEGNFGRIADFSVGGGGWLFTLKNDAAPTATMRVTIIGSVNGNADGAASTLSLNLWQFVAMTWAGSLGTNAPKMFLGTLSTPVAEISYNSTAVGTAPQGSDAANTKYLGNRGAVDRTFDGRIAHESFWDQALSVAQLDLLRIFPYAAAHRFSTAGGTVINLKGYYPLFESAAATCLDHSGNGSTGTVTGTTVDIEPPFPWTRRGPNFGVWTPAGVGGWGGLLSDQRNRMVVA